MDYETYYGIKRPTYLGVFVETADKIAASCMAAAIIFVIMIGIFNILVLAGIL